MVRMIDKKDANQLFQIKMSFLSTWGCYYSHIISWSVRGLDRPSLIHFSAFFQRGDDLFDIVVYRENFFVFLEKVVDPGFS